MILFQNAFANLERIAVLEFVTFGVQEIPTHEILLYSDLLRGCLIKELDADKFDVISRESLEVFLSDNDNVVCSDSCEIETAKVIGADFVISGSLIFTSGIYYLTLKLHRTDSGKLLSSSSIKLEYYQDFHELMPFMGKELLIGARLRKEIKRNFFQDFFYNLSYKNVSISSSPSDTHVKYGSEILCISTPCQVVLPKKEVLLEFSRHNYNTLVKNYNIKKTNIIQNTLKSKFGTLSIQADDLNNFSLNNIEYELPYQQQLQAGEYNINAQKECFEPFNKTVHLQEERNLDVEIKFLPKVKLMYYTVRDQYNNEISADILIDDQFVGKSGTGVEVFVCAKKLTIRANDFEQTVHEDFLESQDISFFLPLEGSAFKTSLVQVGQFKMGSPKSEDYRQKDEELHEVELTKDFVMMTTEVTNKLYTLVMDKKSPSIQWFKGISLVGENKPVQNITWVHAAVFANALSEKEGLPQCYYIKGQTVTWPQGLECTGWRLPTEAEWEYAASVSNDGLKTIFSGTDSYSQICMYSNIADLTTYSRFEWGEQEILQCFDKEEALADVAQYLPNTFNLYDMTGNLWEWVWDGYGPYSSQKERNPKGNDSVYRVLRGGGWTTDLQNVRNAHRYKEHKYQMNEKTGKNVGFRLVRSVKE